MERRPPAAQLVVEVFTPDGTVDGKRILHRLQRRLGVRAELHLGARLRRATSHADRPTSASPNMHIVMTVDGRGHRARRPARRSSAAVSRNGVIEIGETAGHRAELGERRRTDISLTGRRVEPDRAAPGSPTRDRGRHRRLRNDPRPERSGTCADCYTIRSTVPRPASTSTPDGRDRDAGPVHPGQRGETIRRPGRCTSAAASPTSTPRSWPTRSIPRSRRSSTTVSPRGCGDGTHVLPAPERAAPGDGGVPAEVASWGRPTCRRPAACRAPSATSPARACAPTGSRI